MKKESKSGELDELRISKLNLEDEATLLWKLDSTYGCQNDITNCWIPSVVQIWSSENNQFKVSF